MSRRSRGFTVVELAIVLSISAILVPLGYVFVRSVMDQLAEASWRLEVASVLRGLNEELEQDRLRPACEAKWSLDADGALHRVAKDTCGGDRVLARGVTRFERVSGGVEVQFALRRAPEHSLELDAFLPGSVP